MNLTLVIFSKFVCLKQFCEEKEDPCMTFYCFRLPQTSLDTFCPFAHWV